jgi:hypothetical protein
MKREVTVSEPLSCFPQSASLESEPLSCSLQSIAPSSETVLRLGPGERITDCFPLWAASDRILEELGKCDVCDRPTFRVVTITSAAGLERSTALCGHHYVSAAKGFPELQRSEAVHSQSGVFQEEAGDG